jgi:hypothetical protein
VYASILAAARTAAFFDSRIIDKGQHDVETKHGRSPAVIRHDARSFSPWRLPENPINRPVGCAEPWTRTDQTTNDVLQVHRFSKYASVLYNSKWRRANVVILGAKDAWSNDTTTAATTTVGAAAIVAALLFRQSPWPPH